MGWNTPDDWNCYYNKCSRCGSKYHASEGGCGCMDDLECQCGSCDWSSVGYNDEPICGKCGTSPHVEGNTISKKHRARKVYNAGKPGEIRPGDLYRRTVYFGHYPGGAFTLSVTKHRLEKGPAWGEDVALAS